MNYSAEKSEEIANACLTDLDRERFRRTVLDVARRPSSGGAGLCAGAGAARAPVIAIHGLTRNSADFEAIGPLLAQGGRRVLAVDVRGRGWSDRATDPMTYRPDVYAKDVLALLDQAGIARAAFVGTSMGGLITMTVAAMRPEAVAAAVLNDIGPEVAPEGLARIAAYSGQAVEIGSWADAADYARRINGVAFPHYGQTDWDGFARRIFRQQPNGDIALDYDPDIAVPIRAAGPRRWFPTCGRCSGSWRRPRRPFWCGARPPTCSAPTSPPA